MVPKLRLRVSESSGVTILLTGIALLVVTFLVACAHLYAELDVYPVLGFASPVGDLLSIFLQLSTRLLYLSIMGWVATIVIRKGLSILLHSKGFTNKNCEE